MSGKCLDEVVEQMSRREYCPGDILWHTHGPGDFLGVIESGEILLEYRLHGRIISSVKYEAGDYVQPGDLREINRPSSMVVRATTNVRLYVLPRQQLNLLKSEWSYSADRRHTERMVWSRLWAVTVAILILLFCAQDLTRIISGTLYLVSLRAERSAPNPEKSLRLLEYAERVDTGAVFAYNQEGYISFQHLDLERAVSAFSAAHEIEQTNSTSLNNLAVLYHLSEEVPEAADFLQRAVENDPNIAIARYNLGIALMNQGNELQALQEFKEAGRIDPDWALPYIQQGFIYLQGRDYPSAEEAARRASRLDPTQQSAHLILAIALYNQRKYHAALEPVELALQLAPEDNVAKFYNALVLKESGEPARALAILRHLLPGASDPLEVSRIEAEIESIHRALQSLPINAR
jgi:tetratricopeptide (TPR) repeat protein